jgi:internalin A
MNSEQSYKFEDGLTLAYNYVLRVKSPTGNWVYPGSSSSGGLTPHDFEWDGLPPSYVHAVTSGSTASTGVYRYELARDPAYAPYPPVTLTIYVDGNVVFQQSYSDNGSTRTGSYHLISNRAPSITVPGTLNHTEGDLIEFNLSASDPDSGDDLTFSASGLPIGATLNGNFFSWQTQPGDADSYAIDFTVTDDGSPRKSDSATTNINLAPVPNQAPVLVSVNDITVTEGQTVFFQLSGTDAPDDPSGDNLTFSMTGSPPGAEMTSDGYFNWATEVGDADFSPYSIICYAEDDGDPPLEHSQQVNIYVNEKPNTAPVLQDPGDWTGEEGEEVSFNLYATDADGDPLTFSANDMPAGASLTQSGAFYWETQVGDADSYDIQFFADDGEDSSNAQWTTITVNPGVPTLTAPTLNSPTGGTRITTRGYVDFSWNDVSNAETYHLTVNVSAPLPAILWQGAVGDTDSYRLNHDNLINGYLLGALTWTVKAGAYDGGGAVHWGPNSSPGTFYHGELPPPPPDPPAAPTLVSPTSGANIIGTSATLQWNSVATATDYFVEVADNSAFNPPHFSDWVGNTTSYTVTGLTNDGSDTYSWRVSAKNGDGTGPASASRWFDNDPGDPPDPPDPSDIGVPAPISPSTNDVVPDTSVDFSWQSVSDADQYQLRIETSTGSTFSSPVSSDTTESVGSFPDDGSVYFWQVRAHRDGVWGNYCSKVRFISGDPPVEALEMNVLTGANPYNVTSRVLTLHGKLLHLSDGVVDSELSAGTFTWNVKNSGDTQVASGNMAYDSSAQLWTSSNALPAPGLSPGEYIINYIASINNGDLTDTASSPLVITATYSVTGQVRDVQSDDPISGADVELFGPTGAAGPSGTTDTNGNYTLTNVPFQDWTIAVTKTNYAPHKGSLSPSADTVTTVYDVDLWTENGNNPVVTKVSASCDAIFLAGVPMPPNPHEIAVHWAGTVGNIEVYANETLKTTVPGGIDGATVPIPIESWFTGSGDSYIKVVAVNGEGDRSDPHKREVTVIPLPAALAQLANNTTWLLDSECTIAGQWLVAEDVQQHTGIPFLGKAGPFMKIYLGVLYKGKSGEWEVFLQGKTSDKRAKDWKLTGIPAEDKGLGFAFSDKAEVLFNPKFSLSGVANKEDGFQLNTGTLEIPVAFRDKVFDVLPLNFFPQGQALTALGNILGTAGVDLNSLQRIEVWFDLTSQLDGSVNFNPDFSFGQIDYAFQPGIEAIYNPRLAQRCQLKVIVGGNLKMDEGKLLPVPPTLPQNLKLDMYAKAEVIFLSFKGGPYSFTIFATPPAGTKNAVPIQEGALAGHYLVPLESSGWQPIDRSYLDAGKHVEEAPPVKTVVENEGALATAEKSFVTSPETVIISDTYPNSELDLASHQSEAMALYVHDSGASGTLIPTDINWSRMTGGSWSAPTAISTDSRIELSPRIAFDGSGNAVAVWNRVKDVNFSGTEPGDMAPELELVTAYRDASSGTWSSPVALTNNSHIDYMHLLSGPMSDGSLILTWVANEANQFVGTSTSDSATSDDVMWASWNPATKTWTTPQELLSDVNYLTGQSLAARGTEKLYAYTRDLDGDFATTGDQEVFYTDSAAWGTETRLTLDLSLPVEDSGVRAGVAGDGTTYIVWHRNNALVVDTNGQGNPTQVLTDNDSMGLMDTTLTVGPNDELVVAWQQTGESGSDYLAIVRDPDTALWSVPTPLTQTSDQESAFALAWNGTGDLLTAYQRAAVSFTTQTVDLEGGGTFDFEHVPTLGQADIVANTHQLPADLTTSIELLNTSSSKVVAGTTIDVRVVAQNAGVFSYPSVDVAVFDEDSGSTRTEIYRYTLPEPLVGNSEQEFSFTWVLPAPSAPRTLVAVIDPDDAISEDDENNNEANLPLGGPDLDVGVGSHDLRDDGSGRIVANVRNDGSTVIPTFSLVFRLPGFETYLATQTVGSLGAGQSIDVPLDLPAGTFTPGQTLYELEASLPSETDDTFIGDNSLLIWLGLPEVSDPNLDTDGDGLSDSDETSIHGTSPTMTDSDGDGFSDYDEVTTHNTDPTDDSDFPAFLVSFPDPNLEAAVRSAISKPTGGIYTSDLVGVGFTSLIANGASIGDLTGLEYATDLTSLHLYSNDISDVSPIVGLVNLTVLDLGDNYLGDIGPLAGLTNLTELWLDSNIITNLSPLAGLTNLTFLNLYSNFFSDIGALTGLGDLITLAISYNFVSDLGALVSNTGIDSGDNIYVGLNPLSHVAICTNIPALTDRGVIVDIDLLCGGDYDGDGLNDEDEADNNADPYVADTDEDGLNDGDEVNTHGTDPGEADTDGDGLDDGDEINTHGTNPTDTDSDDDQYTDGEEITTHGTDPNDSGSTPNFVVTFPDSALEGAVRAAISKPSGDIYTSDLIGTGFSSLAANSAGITDLGGLEFARNLITLNLDSNSISDVSALAGLTSLTTLDLGSNSISDVSALAGLTNLTTLDLGSNSISDVSALAGLTSLTTLDLYAISISDVSALAGLTNLTTLDLGSNSISDVSALAGLTSLSLLYLDYNSISDVSALSGLTSLVTLYLDHNDIKDVAALVANPGLDAGDSIYLDFNPLGVDAICPDVEGQIGTLRARGVSVDTSLTCGGDRDGDNLDDSTEFYYNSDPFSADTDGDGITDGVEVYVHYTSPTDTDTDGDGLLDGYELNVVGTHPRVADPTTVNTSIDVPRAIVDTSTITSTITIPVEGAVTELQFGSLTLDITHSYDADLDVYLTSPSGTTVEAFTDVGGSGNNFTNTTLYAGADVNIASGTAPFTGIFEPEGSATDFLGETSVGTWTLTITDDEAGDVGTLNSWSLTFLGPMGLPPGPTDIVYVDFGYAGQENGSAATPWNTLAEALAVVDTNGTIRINGTSSTLTSSETFTGANVINKPVRIEASPAGGSGVRIGVVAKGLLKSNKSGVATVSDGADSNELSEKDRNTFNSFIAELIAQLGETGETSDEETEIRNGTVHAKVLPYTRAEGGDRLAWQGVPIAIRLRSEASIDPDSVWAGDVPGALGVAAVEAGDTRDVWVIVRPDDEAYFEEVLAVTAGATDVDGAAVEAEPFAFNTDPDVAVEGLPTLPEGGVEVPQAIEPEQVYPVPQRIWLPVPSGQDPSSLQLYYFHAEGEDRGWYPAENVEGWLVPDSEQIITEDGDTYIGYLVRHAGIVQLGQRQQ